MTIGIYSLTNQVNGKVYVGQSWNVEIRWRGYLRQGCSIQQPKLHYAFRKYGTDKFNFSVIEQFTEDAIDQVVLDAREIHWIDALNCIQGGYNCTAGGGGCKNPSDETRARMRLAAIGRGSPSDATRAKLSAAGKGRKPTPATIAKLKSHAPSEEHRERLREANLGKPCTEETKVKLALANLGKTHSEVTRAKISDLGRGRVFTPETRSKISQSNQGRVFTDEHREKLREARRKRVTTDETKAKMSASQKARYGHNEVNITC